ncbi:hypothetical protein [Nocardiopsis alba]|uniref:hypothetical protein n=1 Tax=Nocardiopsis alba TaxID=53437 RepID=UPI0033B1C9D4
MPISTLALASGLTSAEDHRTVLGALLGGAAEGGPLDRRQGLFHGEGAADLGGSGMTATIAPFVAAVRGASASGQATYLVAGTEDIEVELADGPAEQDRIDVLGLVIRDSTYDGSGEQLAEVRVIDPDVDETYIPLFEITVPQGATTGEGGIEWPAEPGATLPEGIRDLRDYTAAAGGVVRVPDGAARGRMEGEGVQDGTLVHVVSEGNLYIRTEGEWRTVAGPAHEERRPKTLTGLVIGIHPDTEVVDGGITYLRGTAEVRFPEGAFSEAPLIFLTASTRVPGRVLEVSVSSRTAEGFTINVARRNDTMFSVFWMAVEATEPPLDLRPDSSAEPVE